MIYEFKERVVKLMFPLKYENNGALFIFPLDEKWESETWNNGDGYMYRISD